VTLWINLIAVVLAWAGSIPLGIRSARRQGSLEDRVTTNSLFLLWSLPSFFVGALLLHHFCTDGVTFDKAPFPNQRLSSPDSLWLGIFSYMGDLIWHGFLPMVVLSYASFTALSRYMRANLMEQLGADYARTAFAKGCSEDRVVYRHCLRNSLITMITLGSGLLGELFSGALIVEMLFSIPGLGLLMLEGAKAYDAPLVMGSTVISVGLLLLGILVADICYALVDPRVRSRYA
jgi:peptide/nickel transport system permease protein